MISNFKILRSKAELYAKIQEGIYALRPKSTDEEIEKFFQIIPSTFFDEKENLIMLCQLFAFHGRYDCKMGRVTIKLFEHIMHYIKQVLQDESSLIWNIFGSCSYFKFWMYKQGLIDIEQILHSSFANESSMAAQYFLPEIIEYDPKYFYDEIKLKFPYFSSESTYSEQSIEDHKILRDKHLKWLIESNDFNDETYKEIEKNPIRLAIKTDDISTFQFLLSRSNLSVNSVISESVIENSFSKNIEMHYIEFAAKYSAMNIFNFLILNNAEIDPIIVNFAVHHDNYEIIHQIEPKLYSTFIFNGMLFAIESWDSDLINYIMEKYHHEFFLVDDDENDDFLSDDDDDKESEEEEDNGSDRDSDDSDDKESGTVKDDDDERKKIDDEVDKKDDAKKEIVDDDKKETDNEVDKKDDAKKEIDDDDKKEIDNEVDNAKKKTENEVDKKDDDDDNEADEQTKRKKRKSKQNTKFYDVNAVFRAFNKTISSSNMMFLNSIILPFFKYEDALIVNFPTDIISSTIQDLSSFCTDLFMHFPRVQKRRPITIDSINTLITRSIDCDNSVTIEKLINNEKAADIDINVHVIVACAKLASIKIIKILTQHKSFDINFIDPEGNVSAIHIALMSGHYFALKYLIETFPDFKFSNFADGIYYCFTSNHLMALKYFIKYLKRKLSDDEFLQMLIDYIKYYKNIVDDPKVILDLIQFMENV